MGEVHCRDPRTGIVYVYSSHSYWDKQTKTKKAERKLIGKLDEYGNVVPTNGHPGRMKKQSHAGQNTTDSLELIKSKYEDQIRSQEKRIRDLEFKVRILTKEKESLIFGMEQLLSKYRFVEE